MLLVFKTHLHVKLSPINSDWFIFIKDKFSNIGFIDVARQSIKRRGLYISMVKFYHRFMSGIVTDLKT